MKAEQKADGLRMKVPMFLQIQATTSLAFLCEPILFKTKTKPSFAPAKNEHNNDGSNYKLFTVAGKRFHLVGFPLFRSDFE